jgi:hypothetical protein
MIIPTHLTENSFKHKILKLTVSAEIVGIIIIIIIIIIIVVYQLQNNKKQWLLRTVFGGQCRFKATEFCTAVWQPPFRGTKESSLYYRPRQRQSGHSPCFEAM